MVWFYKSRLNILSQDVEDINMKYINSYLPVVSNIYSSHEASWGPMIDVVVLPLFGTEKMLDNKDVGDLSSKCNSCLFFSQNFMTCVLLNLHLKCI